MRDPRSLDHRRGEQGSAYMLVLMLLFVLTIVGLSLTVVTQTEIMVGSNERSIQRVLYAAESGIGVAAARILQRNNFEGFAFDVKGSATQSTADLDATDRVTVFRILRIAVRHCDLCDAREEFKAVNHALTSEATRLIGESGIPKQPLEQVQEEVGGGGVISSPQDGTPIARKTLAVQLEIMPMQLTEHDFIDADSAIADAMKAKVHL